MPLARVDVLAMTLLLILPAVAGCAHYPTNRSSATTESTAMFTAADFAHLKFLEGRWEGTGPDGKPFYEQYTFPRSAEMRSTRFADATFGEQMDGSVVVLQGGRIVSTWGEFTWHASELSPGKACFVPVNAPSSFCWERLSDTSAQVTQRWIDEDGKAQQYHLPLRRL